MRYRIVTPTTVMWADTLDSALYWSLKLRDVEETGVYIYYEND